MDPAGIHREPDVENLRTDFIGCPSLLTRHAKKKKKKKKISQILRKTKTTESCTINFKTNLKSMPFFGSKIPIALLLKKEFQHNCLMLMNDNLVQSQN